jgi:DNA polymerase-3 subunit alpha
VSDANLKGFYYKPLTDMSVLREYGKGIIALSACLGGQIPQLIMKGDVEQAKELALEYASIFDEFYLEVQPGTTPEQVMVNETLIQMSKEINIPLVCTSDSHYLRKEDGEIHDILLAVQTGKKVDDPDRMRFPEMINWLKSEEEMKADGMPEEAIANTQHIAEVCNVEIPLDRLLVPAIDVPLGYTPDTYLSKLCYDGLFKYALTKPIDVDKYKERLKYELDIVQQKELSGYFLIVRDFIKWAVDHGIMVGPGRGSAAGSLISYTAGITKLDPLEHGLLFERRMNAFVKLGEFGENPCGMQGQSRAKLSMGKVA